MYVLLFDIDGTLLSSGGAGQAAMEAALQREFGHDRPVTGISTAGRTDFAITSELFAYYGLTLDEPTWRQFQAAYFDLLPSHLSGRTGLVLPGVLHLLELLAERDDVAVGLLTGNFEHGARLKLQHFAIEHHFAFGQYGDHHSSRDDVARAALLRIQREHPGVPVERVWVIGDTPADIQCARAIGAKVLAVATGMFTVAELAPHAPDLLRESLADPPTWLPAMLPLV
ncbi:MAG: haloacid dehalogenase-like hydrolase [Planctomycetaceae bacterium]|nr:haloacid dehalogenase-like hydrolase [Planctomycetaceae bacterium]